MTSLAGLRVGIVTPSLAPVGGTELYVHSLLEVHRALGIHTTVFVGGSGSPYELNGAHVIFAGDALSESRNPLPRGRIRRAARTMAEAADRSCDLIELHRCAPAVLMRELPGRLPQVLYLHTAELTCPAKGRYLPVSRTVCERAPSIACLGVHAREHCLSDAEGLQFPPAQRLRAALHTVLTRQVSRRARAVVCNSEALKQQYQAGIDSSIACFVLPPPLPAQSSTPTCRHRRRILFVGRLHAVKAPEDTLLACAAIEDAELVVVGVGPDANRLHCLAAELGIAGRTHFRGWLDTAAVGAEMAAASVVLVPSRLFEAWGMVGPEAVAQGCHVVAYDSGGIREWCRPPWGTLVPTGNLNALIAATRRALNAAPPEGERADWSRAARELWGADAYRSRYAAILAEVAAGRRPAP